VHSLPATGCIAGNSHDMIVRQSEEIICTMSGKCFERRGWWIGSWMGVHQYELLDMFLRSCRDKGHVGGHGQEQRHEPLFQTLLGKTTSTYSPEPGAYG
jgi:hypothetical protein